MNTTDKSKVANKINGINTININSSGCSSSSRKVEFVLSGNVSVAIVAAIVVTVAISLSVLPTSSGISAGSSVASELSVGNTNKIEVAVETKLTCYVFNDF